MPHSSFRAGVAACAVLFGTRSALAQEPEPTPVEEPAKPAPTSEEPTPAPAPAEPVATPKPPRYDPPFYMRPLVLPNAVIRGEMTFASYEDKAANAGGTTVGSLSGLYKIPGTGATGSGVGVCARLTLVHDSPPTGDAGTVVANPLLCGTYALAVSSAFRLNFFGGFTLPVGGGGGDGPGAAALNARSKGALARSAMENPIYGVNDFTLLSGIGAGVLVEGVTLQLDVGVTHSIRVRGEPAQPEASKTNFTTGLHIGYFVHENVSIGAELHYQRWINPPFAVEKDPTDATRDNLTLAIGPRAHIPLGFAWLRPGVSYARGLDKPMAAATPNYHIVQLDIPVTF